MFECAASLRKCNLSAEEATLARGIVLTFTGMSYYNLAIQILIKILILVNSHFTKWTVVGSFQ